MKLLIAIQDNSVAPRFDLATEVVIAEVSEGRLLAEPRTIILPRKSAEDISDLIVKEDVRQVICGGIEDGLHRFFTWKKITVTDGVIGDHGEALDLAVTGGLHPGQVLSSARRSQR